MINKENWKENYTHISNEVIDNEKVLRVIKSGKINEYDENTYAKLVDSSFHNGIIEVKMLSRLLKEAPDIKILSVRTLQADNRCMLSAIIHALEFCIEQKVDVINLSLGSCGSTSSRLRELQQVCERATQRGIVIFAADNNISGKKSYPANFENVIGVVAPENQKEFC